MLFTKCYQADQINENEMGGSSSAQGEMRNVLRTSVRDRSEKFGVDGKIILKWNLVATLSSGIFFRLQEIGKHKYILNFCFFSVKSTLCTTAIIFFPFMCHL